MSSNTDAQSVEPEQQSVRIPIMQRVLDNPFFLLFLGVTVPAVFYILWGLIELTHMPIAK